MIEPYVATVLALLDRDQDGLLSEGDVRRYLGVYRMPKTELDEILGKIDPAQRGVFTKQEIFELAKDFYFATDEHAPGNWLLGRY
jgi:Ca2+-binding EF-hand superfamily protein